MKKLLIFIAALGIVVSGQSQTTNTIVTQLKGYTNIVAIPYFKYDFTTHKNGYGGAFLYRVTDNFWAGFRADQIDGQQTTAGVQAQLQTTFSINGLSLTPFVETSVGLGSSELYGTAGPGLLIHLYQHTFTRAVLDIGIVGDYEKVVYNGVNTKQGNIGPMIHLSF
jgi:hypothetical protein